MGQILVHSEKLNKGWLEVHFVEGKTSKVTMNAILIQLQIQLEELICFSVKIQRKLLMKHSLMTNRIFLLS